MTFNFWSFFWDFEFLAWFASVNILSFDHIDLSLTTRYKQAQPIEDANGFVAFSMIYNINRSRTIQKF